MTTTFARISVSASMALAFLTPVSAFAYLSPDDVFGSGDAHPAALSPATESPFPTKRDAEAKVLQQQQNSATARTAVQMQNLKPVDSAPVDSYVAPVASKPASRLDPEVNYELRMQRLSAEKSNSPSIIIAGQGTVVDSNGNVLHSGAPSITGTGPESVLALIVLVLAGIGTFAMTTIRRPTMRVS